jgi:hypothetical protein
MERLEEDDWRRVKAYEGRAKFTTYISLVALRLLEDFARHRFGRARPPAWVKAQGPVWEEVYRLLCLERMSITDVVKSVIAGAPGKRSESVVEEAVGVILSRVTDCGRASGEALSVDPDQLDGLAPAHPSLHHLTPEEFLAACERVTAIEAIGSCLKPVNGKSNPRPLRDVPLSDLHQRLQGRLNLDTEERLFLKAIYQDGLGVSSAGRLLGWNANAAHGKLRRLLARLRKAIEGAGLEQELKAMVEKSE